ncbi:MAG: ABC transporter permease [Verrucomicrobiales bacterium]
MRRFLLSRLVQSVLTLFAIVTVTFLLVHAAPGGPFKSERAVSPHIRKQLLAAYGLDQPLPVQYGRYLGNLLRGDLGVTTKYEGWTVGEIIRSAFPVSLQLGLTALTIALLIGLPIGIVAAVRRNSALDYAPMALAMIGICLPTFVMGPILALVLGIKLNFFNVAGWYDKTDWVLPSLTLGLYYAAYISRMARAGVLEVLGSDFIRTARAKGVPGSAVVLRHSLKVGLTPVVAYLGPALAGLVTGSFVVETVFQLPGLGQHFVAAARNSDYTLLLGVTVFYATLLIGANILVDLLQAWMNPRIRLHEA